MLEPAACPKCHALETRRIRQQGFVQQAILRRLGYYPWECRFCKATYVLKNRGLQETGKRRLSELEEGPAEPRLGAHPAD